MALKFLFIIQILILVVPCICNSFVKIMKQPINNVIFPKLLNSTSEIGSKSTSSSSGVIYRITTIEELEAFNKNNLSGKFAVVLQADLVNKKNLRELEASNKVEGVIVIYDDNQGSIPYSPDKQCPNCEFGMYSEGERANYKWNPYGDGLLFEYFDIPIFGLSVNKSSEKAGIAAIINADNFNKERKYKNYPLYSIKFESFMYASKDSETCLSRGYCDPIGGNSVWSSYSKTIDPNDGKKIIIVSSQIDGNSLFHDNTIGSNSQIGGMVANLAIADALSKSEISPDQFQNHIVFTFFSGEAYGYGGSQRFVHDISNYECKNNKKDDDLICSGYAACQEPCMYVDDFKNITLDNIKGIIELNQLTCSGCNDINNPTYFMHVDDETDTETLKITNLISKVYTNTYGNNMLISNNNNKKRQSNYYNIKPAWEGINNLGLPPASAQSFLKKKKIPAVVISDFQTEFTNKHYHSGFDIDSNTTVYNNTICKTADIIAKSIWLYAQNKEMDDIISIPPSVNVDCQYVNDLMYCLTHNINCPLVKSLLNSTTNNNLSKISHYSGVFNIYSLNGAINTNYNYDTWVANFAMIVSTGKNSTTPCNDTHECVELEYPDFANLDKEKQQEIKKIPFSLRKYQCISGYCIEGKSYAHPAYGTGLTYNAKDGLYSVNDKNLPTWTESRWDENTLTIYFTTSKTFQYIELFVGVIIVGLTIFGYYFIKKYTIKNIKTS